MKLAIFENIMTPTPDARFFELPLTETRKTPEEIPTHKRALYRRRFALLDNLDASIEKILRGFMT